MFTLEVAVPVPIFQTFFYASPEKYPLGTRVKAPFGRRTLEGFVVERDKKYGENLEYSNYNEVEKDFKAKKLHLLDLKNSVAKEINKLLETFRKDKQLKQLYNLAYG